MKKFLLFVAAATISGSLLAGGLVTNTNHSAYMTRILSRHASTGVDAVDFNPAGLTSLDNGFHFSLNNQVIGQTKTITNDYYFLNQHPTEYIGKVSAPIFPGVYAVYKKDKLAFSLGFNPVGGGGGAEYATGLPSFEMGISQLVPILGIMLLPLDQGVIGAGYPDPAFSSVTGYNADIYFKGSSVYFGYQANISYEISDMISVAVGGRFVSAKNTYEGYISNVTITASPSAYTGLTTPYTGSPGDYLRAIALTAVGGSNATMLNGSAAVLDGMTNVEADVVETGTGFTPILSVNITPNDKFNVALRYEFKTKLNLTTTVNDGKDAGGMFEDGAIKVADMPAMMSLGVGVRPASKLYIAAGMGYYFDNNNDYDGSTDLNIKMTDKNFFEYSVGIEYAISNMIRISGGYSGTMTGVNENYRNDMRYSLNTTTFGGGFGFAVSPKVDINIGAMYTMYQDGSKSLYPGDPLSSIIETYDTSTWVVGFGADFHF
ncbi:MAG: hypothetical protein E4G92_01680 [Bacteroidia bacterium]|nr:MAG: hypothetical protein E4G92_01680 [Bacteroidia bacterium]